MLDLANIGILTSGALGDLQKMVGRYFKDERMQQSLSFQTLYPRPLAVRVARHLLAAAVRRDRGRHLLSHGRMFQLAPGLERWPLSWASAPLWRAGGALSRPGRSVRAALLADGSRVRSDDRGGERGPAIHLRRAAPAPYPGIEQKRVRCSVVLMYIGTNRTWPHLEHHNFVRGPRHEDGCDDLFVRHRMPEIRRSTSWRVAYRPGSGPPGGESLFVLVLAPSQPAIRTTGSTGGGRAPGGAADARSNAKRPSA
jgi:phytoene desaturase